MKLLFVLTALLVHPNFKQLTWSDFKGKPNGEAYALTVSRIDIVSFEENNKVRWDVEAVFDPDSSFIQGNDPKILAHEQLHFDITQIFAQKIIKFLEKYQNCGVLLSKSVEIVIDRYIVEWRREELRYDAETKHSELQSQQKTWEIRIQNKLQTLKLLQ